MHLTAFPVTPPAPIASSQTSIRVSLATPTRTCLSLGQDPAYVMTGTSRFQTLRIVKFVILIAGRAPGAVRQTA